MNRNKFQTIDNTFNSYLALGLPSEPVCCTLHDVVVD